MGNSPMAAILGLNCPGWFVAFIECYGSLFENLVITA